MPPALRRSPPRRRFPHHRPAAGLALTALTALTFAAPAPAAAHLTVELPTPADAPRHAHLAYDFNGFGIEPHEQPLRLVVVGGAPDGIAPDKFLEAARRSAATWNRVGCSAAQLDVVAHRASLDELEPGEVPIYFPPVEHWDFFGENKPIATTNHRVRLEDGGVDRAIMLNRATIAWALAPSPFESKRDGKTIVDLQSVLTHEIGHILGLADIYDDRVASMYRGYMPDGGQRVLAADDKLGVCALYPREGDECVRDEDCGVVGQTCVGEPGARVCEKERGELGAYCALNLLHCPELCLFNASGTGYCTLGCGGEATCPAHYECLEADDASGSYCVLTGAGFDDGAGAGAEGCAVGGGSGRAGAGLVAVLVAALLGARRRFARRQRSVNSTPRSMRENVR